MTPSTAQPGCAPSQAAARSQTELWTAGSRTTPPWPTTAAGFELRLDQRHQCGVRRSEREWRRQHRRQTDKTSIASYDFDGLGNLLARQHTRVDPLAHDDARVLAQLPGELAVADIDGVDLPRAARQQHIGEAAGRGADIERDPSGVDAEMVEPCSSLRPPRET